MNKVITDKIKIKEVLERGVEQIFPGRAAFEKVLLSGKRIRLYCGFDPSAVSLHIGNAIQLNKLSQFQELGHEVIFLVGDFTGMIGDPTDKTSARRKMTRAEVLANSRNYEKQASAYLRFTEPNPALIRHNSEWSDPLTFKDLIEISANFTVQQMIARDMFQERLKQEKPIYLHEFLYPLAQGYDSVGMDVDLEIGGNDQMFNMLCGRTLMKAIKNKEKFVMTSKLLADPGGKKMGKSEGNAVFLDEAPDEIYGKIMSWPDGVIALAFELCTKAPLSEVAAITRELKDPKINPRDFKMRLAREMVKLVYDEKTAGQAQDHFIKTFQKKETPDEVRSKKLEVRSMNIVELLVAVDLASSKNEARRLVRQGGIKIDNAVVKDESLVVEVSGKEVLIQRGKRQFLKVIGKKNL